MDKKALLMTKREKLVLSPKSALSTGSTLLNLACTDTADFGFVRGNYYYLVGDSTSGKTWLSLTCFAEACLNKNFQDYEFIFDDVEGGALMDIEHYFGKAVANRMRPPSTDGKGHPINSYTVEAFYTHLWHLIQKRRKFIYVLDSQDALDSESASKKRGKQRAAAESGEQAKGSYGDGKAKYHSENIRWVLTGLRKTGSILIIIGQTRDNVNGFGFDKKTRSGGKSLRFYANTEIWTSVGKRIIKTVRDVKRTVGGFILAVAKKNRVTGKIGRDRQVTIPIYNGYGIDDVGSCVDYMVANGAWKIRKGEEKIFVATDLEFTGTRREIITFVENTGLEHKLREVVETLWQQIEKECQLQGRKRRYT